MDERKFQIFALNALVISQVTSWWFFLTPRPRPNFFSGALLTATIVTILTIITIFTIVSVLYRTVVITRQSGNNLLVLFAVLNAFSLILVNFSLLYWIMGTTANFTADLSRLDAIYFAVGTLTTAGTGNIAATSEVARLFVTIQMVLDLAFVAVAIGVAVAKWSERPRSSSGQQ